MHVNTAAAKTYKNERRKTICQVSIPLAKIEGYTKYRGAITNLTGLFHSIRAFRS